MATEYAAIAAEAAGGDYLPDHVRHGHATIGAVKMCQEEPPCAPHRGVIVEFDPETRLILGVK